MKNVSNSGRSKVKAAEPKKQADLPPSKVSKKANLGSKTGKPTSSKKTVSVDSVVESDGTDLGTRPWLMDLVYQHANDLGLNVSDLTQRLGYSPGYLFHLKAQPHKCSKLGLDMVRKLAEFLGVDSVTVMVAAGILRPNDFFGVDDVRQIRSELERTVRYIAEDLDWAPFVPRPVETLSDNVLMLTVYAYQRATGRSLMEVKTPTQAFSAVQVENARRAKQS